MGVCVRAGTVHDRRRGRVGPEQVLVLPALWRFGEDSEPSAALSGVWGAELMSGEPKSCTCWWSSGERVEVDPNCEVHKGS